ncbi:MAG: type II secretion system F family protein [Alphaproteobacteria bacterium]|nr:type II secretion system F family protein [Alphaproteobacteria bacterium]
MHKFKYRAVNSQGQIYRSVLKAESHMMLYQYLKARNLHLLNARRCYEFESFIFKGFKQNIRDDLIKFCLHMAEMDRVGIPLLEALGDMRHFQVSIKLRRYMDDIYNQISGGMMLSEALSHYPQIFDHFFIQIIQMSEHTGRLHQGFDKLIVHLKWTQETHHKLVQALRYPLILGGIVISTFVVLLTTLVPQLMEFLRSLNISPPATTLALIAISNFIQNYGFVFLTFIIFFIGTIAMLYCLSFQIAIRLDNSLFYIPLIGPLWKKILILRYFQALSMTLSTGIDILESLSLSENMVENRALKLNLQGIRNQVTGGMALSQAVEMSSIFSSGTSHMLKSGEESGQLLKVLEIMKYFHETEINNQLKFLIDFIEPGLILTIGGFMVWLIMAMFYPIYDQFSIVNL